jgi:hypothetical protein
MNCGFATRYEIKDFCFISSQADSCWWCLAAGSACWQDTHQMLKFYEYLGIVVLFYSNEHEPIHVHGQCQDREGKAELIVENGKVVQIIYSAVKGRQPLSKAELKNFQTVIERYAEEIVQKWIDYFVLHKPIAAQKIT